MEELIIKNSTVDMKTGERKVEYCTEEECKAIKDKQIEEEKISELIPSAKDALMAEIEINTITLLQEVGLIWQ